MKHPNKLRHYRLLKGLSEKQVAEYMGLKSEDVITRWENGETMPRNGVQVLQLAIMYDVSLKDLYPELAKLVKKEMAANAKKLKQGKSSNPKGADKKMKSKKV